MTEIVLDTKEALNAGYEDVVRIPAGVMNLIRESYDTRERVLDWILAFFVAGALIYAFWGPIVAMVNPPKDVNVGKDDITPNQNVKEAVGNIWQRPNIERMYTYNMPSSRAKIASRIGPSSVRIPYNPAYGPQYNPNFEEINNAG